MRGFRIPYLIMAAALALGGCNLRSLTIRGQVDSSREFSEERGTHYADPEMLGPVIADSTVTNEGFLYYVPDYEPLLMSTIFSNMAYGQGWLIADAEKAELEGNFDKADKLRQRAGLLFARALFYAKRMLRLRDEGFDAAVAAGPDGFAKWVDEIFYTEEDAEVLLLAGMAYLVSMVESEEGLAANVDMPYARHMLERSIELDPTLEDGNAYTMIGIIECTVPELVGGRPRAGLKLMQKAAELTDRRNHSVLVSMAERCAVALQDRKMYRSLLMEVIESGDVEEFRLPNKLARHKAERLLQQIDEFFYD